MGGNYRNAQGEQFPEGLMKVADRVLQLVEVASILKKWRSRVGDWAKTQPPRTKNGRWAQDLVPVPLQLTLLEKYALLAAVYDHALGLTAELERIEPDSAGPVWAAYSLLKVTLAEHCDRINVTDFDRMLRWVDHVKEDLKPLLAPEKAKPGGKGGPKPLSNIAADKGLVDEWERSGLVKKVFEKQRKLLRDSVQRAQGRLRKAKTKQGGGRSKGVAGRSARRTELK